MLKALQEAVAVVRDRVRDFPQTVLVLGSGLSPLVDQMETEVQIPFSEIPHVPSATVAGHAGRLVVGSFCGERVAVMQGRLHFYEGRSLSQVVFPFRVLALAGGQTFVLTNAAGGLDPSQRPMDLLLIRDHINLMGSSPLIGENLEELGPRFPDLTFLYDEALRSTFRAAAKEVGVELREGVYIGVHGPAYETPAEMKMCRILGGDVVGMSTVPEAIALRHMGRKVVGISCITNLAAGVTGGLLAHEEVLENAQKVHTTMGRLFEAVLPKIRRQNAN